MNDTTKYTADFNELTTIGLQHIGDSTTYNYYVDQDPLNVSYDLIDIDQVDPIGALQYIANAINLSKDGKDIPFIPPIDFGDYRLVRKLLVYGVHGCGKDRIIYEILKDRITEFKRVHIIYPQNSIETVKQKKEMSIKKLIDSGIDDKDIVIWGDYSNDLHDAENVEIGLAALIRISSARIKNLFLSLNSDLLASYENLFGKVPYVAMYRITYDKKGFIDIFESYGKHDTRFKTIYEKYVVRDKDRIAEILYNTDPNPSAIHLFYEDLVEEISKNPNNNRIAVDSAQRFAGPEDYYKRQLSYISGEKARQSDLHFLYVLKLCYESGLRKTYTIIEELQNHVFGTPPPAEPSRYLSSWVSIIFDTNYSISNTAKNIINYPKDSLSKTLTYLTQEGFLDKLSEKVDSFYKFGKYIGMNIRWIKFEELIQQISKINKSRINLNDLLSGLGLGVAKNFPLLDAKTQKEIISETINNADFSRGFGDMISRQFSSLAKTLQDRMLTLIAKNDEYALRLGSGLAYHFPTFDNDMQSKILTMAEKNQRFELTIFSGLAYHFPTFDNAMQSKILTMAEKKTGYTSLIARTISYCFISLNKEIQEQIFHLAERNSAFAQTFGENILTLFT